jgi:hypothetical protein
VVGEWPVASEKKINAEIAEDRRERGEGSTREARRVERQDAGVEILHPQKNAGSG